MAIFASYYTGQIKGEAVSFLYIHFHVGKGGTLPYSLPPPFLSRWWKSSSKDAQEEYKRQFQEFLTSRQQLKKLWVNRHKDNPQDITLCCYEKPGDFCHRHQVGAAVPAGALGWGSRSVNFGSQKQEYRLKRYP